MALLPTLLVSQAHAEETPVLTAEQKALAQAKESGERVELNGRRSERTTVYANPDGYTFTLEESAVPVRVAKDGGGWTAPDPTLVVRPDGSVVPKAAAVDMQFSAGGADDPLVTISNQGRHLALGWPGKLPTPKLDGASALYSEVLPGVDLKVMASTEGFQHILVVKTPQAAPNSSTSRTAWKPAAWTCARARPGT